MLEVAVVFEEAQSSITPFVWPDTDSVKHTFTSAMKPLTLEEMMVCSHQLIFAHWTYDDIQYVLLMVMTYMYKHSLPVCCSS